MDLAREKAVLFLTDFNDPLPREFAVECPRYELTFFPMRKSADWCIAWVCDDAGIVQAWLEHIPSAQSHFLGSDAQLAMSAAARLISEWDKLGSLAVQ